MGVRELWPHWPESILWHTEPFVKAFREVLADELAKSSWFEAALRDMVEYIADSDSLQFGIHEWATTCTHDAETQGFNVADSELFSLLKALGEEATASARQYGLYVYKGVFPYRFSAFFGDDIILEKIKLEELTFLDDYPRDHVAT